MTPDIENVIALTTLPLSMLEGIGATREELALALELIAAEEAVLLDRAEEIANRMQQLLDEAGH